MLDYILELDRDLFLELNALHNPIFDPVMAAITATSTWFPFYGLIVLFLVIEYKRHTLVILIHIIILITLVDQFTAEFCKPFFARVRPCYTLEDVHVVLGCGGRYGFVSSHAANTFGLASFLTLLLQKKFKWVMPSIFLWASLVSYSRIYVGVHYPLDLVFGALSGLISAYLVFKIYNHFFRSKSHS